MITNQQTSTCVLNSTTNDQVMIEKLQDAQKEWASLKLELEFLKLKNDAQLKDLKELKEQVECLSKMRKENEQLIDRIKGLEMELTNLRSKFEYLSYSFLNYLNLFFFFELTKSLLLISEQLDTKSSFPLTFEDEYKQILLENNV